MQNLTTAGIIIIGNEILSGKVQDINSHYLARELRELGVDVKKISVIPDEIETIGSEVFEFSAEYDYVFTSGGVGPTHDDVTMAGIADGFGVKLVEHPGIKEILLSRYRGPANSSVLKMAQVPEGCEINFNEKLRFPVISFKNIFIFPGIPDHVKNKFPLIKEKFRSPSFYLKKIYLNCHESDIAGILNEIVERNKEVAFGSYPVLGNQDYRVIITADARSGTMLKKAVDELLQKLPKDLLVRIE